MIERVYISGPMQGYADHNFPAFEKAAKRLRHLGYEVVSPHEIEQEPDGQWEDFLKKDLREMLTCDTIILLVGWTQSKGAMLELFVARQVGMDVQLWEQ